METANIETVEPEQPVEPRDVLFLVNNKIPYSEMTEEEIASVVEYHAEVKARDEVHAQVIEKQVQQSQAAVTIHENAAASAREDFQNLLASILGKEV